MVESSQEHNSYEEQLKTLISKGDYAGARREVLVEGVKRFTPDISDSNLELIADTLFNIVSGTGTTAAMAAPEQLVIEAFPQVMGTHLSSLADRTVIEREANINALIEIAKIQQLLLDTKAEVIVGNFTLAALYNAAAGYTLGAVDIRIDKGDALGDRLVYRIWGTPVKIGNENGFNIEAVQPWADGRFSVLAAAATSVKSDRASRSRAFVRNLHVEMSEHEIFLLTAIAYLEKLGIKIFRFDAASCIKELMNYDFSDMMLRLGLYDGTEYILDASKYPGGGMPNFRNYPPNVQSLLLQTYTSATKKA